MAEGGQPFLEDRGLDEQSLAVMTPDEITEYLVLLLRVLRPELPSLTWLRRAASSRPTATRGPNRSPRSEPLGKLLVGGKPPIDL